MNHYRPNPWEGWSSGNRHLQTPRSHTLANSNHLYNSRTSSRVLTAATWLRVWLEPCVFCSVKNWPYFHGNTESEDNGQAAWKKCYGLNLKCLRKAHVLKALLMWFWGKWLDHEGYDFINGLTLDRFDRFMISWWDWEVIGGGARLDKVCQWRHVSCSNPFLFLSTS